MSWWSQLSTSAYQANRAGLGILSILAGSFLFTTMDAMMKTLTQYYPVVQGQFLRNLVATCYLTLYFIARRQPIFRLYPGWQIVGLRGLLGLVLGYLFFKSFTFLDLASATTLVFMYPVFVTLLSKPVLGDPVGLWRWAAVLLGFTGVAWIMQPGSTLLQPAALMPLTTAVLLATILLMVRFIPPGTSTLWVTYFASFISLVGITPFALWQWVPLNWADHGVLILSMGLLGLVGGFFVNLAFRYAPATVVASFDYTAILWATFYSTVIFKERPPALLFPGMALIISAGLLIAWRESGSRATTTSSSMESQ